MTIKNKQLSNLASFFGVTHVRVCMGKKYKKSCLNASPPVGVFKKVAYFEMGVIK